MRIEHDEAVKVLTDANAGLMAKHAVMLNVKDLKERDTQKLYDEALQRERGNRQRLVDIQRAQLNTAIVSTERKTDRGWEKICAKLQSQVGVLQPQVAQYELQRVRQDRRWSTKEQHAKEIEVKLRADLTVKDILSC